jgi:hypothetical protein
MRWNQNEVDVIGHQTPGPDLGPRLGAPITEQGFVQSVIIVRKEDLLTTVAALCHMMGDLRDDEAGDARHGSLALVFGRGERSFLKRDSI